MNDEKTTQAVHTASVQNNPGESFHSLQGTEPLQLRINALLMRIDQEAEQFRRKIDELMQQANVLQETSKNKDAREELVLQLQEANQNLVIAALNAQDQQAKAEATNRLQEEFLSMLAHELRNPLAPVAMATDLLGKIVQAHPQLPKLHGIISRQVNHLTHLVEDLVDAARVSSGKIHLQKRALLLSEIIDSAVETSQPFISKRHQQLSVALLADPVYIDGDLVRLAQVFSNLLINASKFTPEYEHIAVSASKLAHAVTISVKDNGMGIEANLQPHIFDLFRQGFRTLDRSQGGLGIGLSLVRTVVALHGGSVTVSSAGAGLGSEFTVTLPLGSNPLRYDHNAVAPAIASRHCRILLIEDNVDANELLQDVLTQEGHTITCSFDGASGLAMAKETVYDAIVCDIGLPGIDGYEVIRQLRLHAQKPVPYVIALSGYSQLEYRTRALEGGFDYYLTKPISSNILINMIAANVCR